MYVCMYVCMCVCMFVLYFACDRTVFCLYGLLHMNVKSVHRSYLPWGGASRSLAHTKVGPQKQLRVG